MTIQHGVGCGKWIIGAGCIISAAGYRLGRWGLLKWADLWCKTTWIIPRRRIRVIPVKPLQARLRPRCRTPAEHGQQHVFSHHHPNHNLEIIHVDNVPVSTVFGYRMRLFSNEQFSKALAVLWVGLCMSTLNVAWGETNGTPTEGQEPTDPIPLKKTPQIRSQSGKSLHNDAKRTRTILPLGEELAPETIDSKGLRGKASFYGPRFQGRKTASGDIFNNRLFTAASNLFPLGTLVAVKRPDTNLCVVVKVNDRMHPRHRARIIDLSQTAARYLDMVREGVIKVQIMKVPADAIAGQTIDCTMGYEVEAACENCNSEESPLQFIER